MEEKNACLLHRQRLTSSTLYKGMPDSILYVLARRCCRVLVFLWELFDCLRASYAFLIKPLRGNESIQTASLALLQSWPIFINPCHWHTHTSTCNIHAHATYMHMQRTYTHVHATYTHAHATYTHAHATYTLAHATFTLAHATYMCMQVEVPSGSTSSAGPAQAVSCTACLSLFLAFFKQGSSCKPAGVTPKVTEAALQVGWEIKGGQFGVGN